MWRCSMGWGRANQSARLSRQGSSRVARRVELLGGGHVGHGELVGEPHLVDVERGRQVEDGPPVLDGHHPAGGERPPVTDPVHLVEDGHGRVPRPEEVGVERVRPARVHGAAGGHQRLGRHLAAEDALRSSLGLHPPEDVDLDRLEVEEVDEEFEGFAHGHILSGVAGPATPRGLESRGPGPAVPLRLSAVPADRPFPTASSGGRRRPPTRSRGATSTTTGGPSSTTRPRAAPSRAATPATPSTAIPEDLALVAALGLAFYRFSVEWSRIEPAEGEFSVAALDHYRRVVAACHERGISPVVTFHHFTNPRWLAARGRLGGARRPRPLRPLLRAGHGPPGRPDRDGRHAQRAQRGGRHGLCDTGSSRPGSVTATGATPSQPGPGVGPPPGASRPSARARATSRWA